MRDLRNPSMGTPGEPAAGTLHCSTGTTWRRSAGAAALLAITVGVSACSSASSSSPKTTSSTPAAGSRSSASASSAASLVAGYRAASNKFTAPGPALDAKSLNGGSLWYVTLSSEIPVLAVEQNGIQQAATALGMTLHVCDGKFQPAVAAGCINSAVSSGAKGILTDSIENKSVSTAVTNATSHGVPILSMSEQGQNTNDVGYFGMGDPQAQAAAADWIIADSGGKANVLGTKVLDDPGAIYDITAGSAPEFAKLCPQCSLETATYTTGSVPSVPSAVSTTLLSHPHVTYGLPQFDFLVPLFKSGVQTAGFANKMNVVSTNSVLSSMQLVKTGGQAADIGSNRNYAGWAATDAMLRLILKLPAPTAESIPIRAFDKTNIDSVSLTQHASATGEWWGGLDYQNSFRTSWGLS